MQQSHGTEPRVSQTDRAIERYKALRKLNLQHPQAVFQAAREFHVKSESIQRELAFRSAAHRHNEARRATLTAERAPYRPDIAPASSVPAGDR